MERRQLEGWGCRREISWTFFQDERWKGSGKWRKRWRRGCDFTRWSSRTCDGRSETRSRKEWNPMRSHVMKKGIKGGEKEDGHRRRRSSFSSLSPESQEKWRRCIEGNDSGGGEMEEITSVSQEADITAWMMIIFTIASHDHDNNCHHLHHPGRHATRDLPGFRDSQEWVEGTWTQDFVRYHYFRHSRVIISNARVSQKRMWNSIRSSSSSSLSTAESHTTKRIIRITITIIMMARIPYSWLRSERTEREELTWPGSNGILKSKSPNRDCPIIMPFYWL